MKKKEIQFKNQKGKVFLKTGNINIINFKTDKHMCMVYQVKLKQFL